MKENKGDNMSEIEALKDRNDVEVCYIRYCRHKRHPLTFEGFKEMVCHNPLILEDLLLS